MQVEFNEKRSKSYKDAINKYPGVWDQDMLVMHNYLQPNKGDVIAEIGAGSGFFSFAILDAIGNDGHLFVIDPSEEQLAPLASFDANNLSVCCDVAENVSFTDDTCFDLIWSRGAFHHVMDKTKAFNTFYNHSKQGAKCVIFDIFSGSNTAKFFDSFVARACTTAHEVSFLSNEFVRSLCHTTGWSEPTLIEVPLQWKFVTEGDVGQFLGLLLANKPEYTSEDTLKSAKEILGIETRSDGVYLNWPMTLMISEKKGS